MELQEDTSARGRGWVFRSHLPSFFSEILFFWKLVSHGGLDFSIFVSSTIWNQCFRSKNCSTAKGQPQRSCCSWDQLPSFCHLSRFKKRKNLRIKVHSWVCWVVEGDSAGMGLCSTETQRLEQSQRLWLSFCWQGAATPSSSLLVRPLSTRLGNAGLGTWLQ